MLFSLPPDLYSRIWQKLIENHNNECFCSFCYRNRFGVYSSIDINGGQLWKLLKRENQCKYYEVFLQFFIRFLSQSLLANLCNFDFFQKKIFTCGARHHLPHILAELAIKVSVFQSFVYSFHRYLSNEEVIAQINLDYCKYCTWTFL